MAHSYSSLYPGHIQLSSLEKLKLTFTSALTAFKDPTRQDMVAALGETTGSIQLPHLYKKMLLDREGRQLLRDKPSVSSDTIDLQKLRGLSKNTFGYNYVKFLDDNGVSPDTRTDVHYIDDKELAYVMKRYRETHDFYHTLLDLPITVEAELLVKYFELCQTQLPLTFLSATVGTFTADRKLWKQSVDEGKLNWVIQNGLSSKFLLSVYFEKYFDMDLIEFRRKLNIWV